VKPTYGAVSRYGVIALASSLDQIGPCARTVHDAALLHQVIAGHDPRDATSLTDAVPHVVAAANKGRDHGLEGVRVGVIQELTGEGFQPGVRQRFEEAVQQLRSLGAMITEVSCPSFAYALAAYYLILPSEASSNLAKFDSVRFGIRVDDGSGTIERVMGTTRAVGFGDEVKRRIILGTYALSAGYYDAYYGSAQKVRTLIQRDFTEAFGSVDVLVSPTCPTTAFKLGAQVDDPITMYLNDIATIPANLAGIPGMSLPIGLAPEDGLPVGLQILAPARHDDRLYRVGAALEGALVELWAGTLLTQAPVLEVAS
jgi:aspartyl-tRNA(Asn)/glutamyl-tRNA(Gln) amidotransferase subunit A